MPPNSRTSLAFGTWPSPVSAATIAQQVVAFEHIAVDISTGEVLHSERRPRENRSVVVSSASGVDAIPKDKYARTIVNGYGGVPMLSRGGTMIFINLPDNKLYKTDGTSCIPITQNDPSLHFADLSFCPSRKEFLGCVIEDSTDPRASEVVTSLATVQMNTGKVTIISSGWDFYASPKFSPDGKKLAFLRWNHPNMPWQSCQLVVADVVFAADSLILEHEKIIAGADDKPTAAQQPRWLSSNTLLFIYDKLDWTQVWMYTAGEDAKPVMKTIVEEDFAHPLWRLGDSSYTILDDKRILCASSKDGIANLSVISVASGTRNVIKSDIVFIRSVQGIDHENVVFIGSKANAGGAIVKMTLSPGSSSDATFTTLRSSDEVLPPAGYAAAPTVLRLSDNEQRILYAYYFPPTNPKYTGLPEEKPPCILDVHAGPTMKSDPGFSWERILYTSRGWSWLDVEFGGSPGYGRQYMDRINGQFGELDPDDCAAAAEQVASRGLIDSKRVVIRGHSSGGYAVLQSLIRHRSTYSCGTAYSGFADMKRLGETTQKFTSHYLSTLLGGTASEIPEVYHSRSPLFHAEKITTPLLLLHGALDTTVPAEQAKAIADAVKEHGGRADIVIYEGEGHGFREAKNIKASLEKELSFFEDVLGFQNGTDE
ncbi:alpha/beta-hydrolase [Schizopora paradoxa]|uniref:Alpha/beta-hydrolase n=1 Tax=Schizopora paradoxa TaxID=27342 RepID=A0A0H2RQA7_9AGAM|nr:alpha/beta-hydrolase [Schizopora paradoxa]